MRKHIGKALKTITQVDLTLVVTRPFVNVRFVSILLLALGTPPSLFGQDGAPVDEPTQEERRAIVELVERWTEAYANRHREGVEAELSPTMEEGVRRRILDAFEALPSELPIDVEPRITTITRQGGPALRCEIEGEVEFVDLDSMRSRFGSIDAYFVVVHADGTFALTDTDFPEALEEARREAWSGATSPPEPGPFEKIGICFGSIGALCLSCPPLGILVLVAVVAVVILGVVGVFGGGFAALRGSRGPRRRDPPSIGTA